MVRATVEQLVRDKGFGFARAHEQPREKFFFHRVDLDGILWDECYVGLVVLGEVVPSMRGPRFGRVVRALD